MKGVGWETDGCLNITQAKKAGELLSDVSTLCVCVCCFTFYKSRCSSAAPSAATDQIPSEGRQHQVHPSGGRSFHQTCEEMPRTSKRCKISTLSYIFCLFHHSSVCLWPPPPLQLAYKASTEQMMHQYTITKDEPLFRQAKANADLLSAVSSLPCEKNALISLHTQDSAQFTMSRLPREVCVRAVLSKTFFLIVESLQEQLGEAERKRLWDAFRLTFHPNGQSQERPGQRCEFFSTCMHSPTTTEGHVKFQYMHTLLHLILPPKVKYKERYEKDKGKVLGIKSVSDDSQMAHLALATKLQSDRHYKKNYEDTKTKYRWSLCQNHLPHSWSLGVLIVSVPDEMNADVCPKRGA